MWGLYNRIAFICSTLWFKWSNKKSTSRETCIEKLESGSLCVLRYLGGQKFGSKWWKKPIELAQESAGTFQWRVNLYYAGFLWPQNSQAIKVSGFWCPNYPKWVPNLSLPHEALLIGGFFPTHWWTIYFRKSVHHVPRDHGAHKQIFGLRNHHLASLHVTTSKPDIPPQDLLRTPDHRVSSNAFAATRC